MGERTTLVILCLAASAWSTPTYFTRQFSELPDYDTYRLLEHGRLLQQQQQNQRTVNESSTLAPTPRRLIGGQVAQELLDEVLRFLHANRVVFYVACAGVLTAVLLLFTLATLHTSGGIYSRPHSTLGLPPEACPLLSRSHARMVDRSDDEDTSSLDGDGCDSSATGMPSDLIPGGDYVNERTDVLSKRPPPDTQVMPVFPKQLLELCNQDVPLSFVAFLPNGNYDRTKWIAHGKHSEVFQVVSLLKRTILKVIPLLKEYTDNEENTLALGIQSHMKLSSLRYGLSYRTPNFIEIQRVACVYDKFPEWLLKSDRISESYDSTAESLASEITGTSQCLLTRHFIVLELCYAGKPLSRIKLRSAVQGRSIVQQVGCSVAVAERALSFAHLTTDTEKVLVTPTDLASVEYRIEGRPPLCVDAAGLKAHITGSLSCMVCADRLRQESPGDADHPPSDTGADELTSERFYNNVIWLSAVLEAIISKLHTDVPDSRIRSERAVIGQLQNWHDRLQQCSSVDEFVKTTFL